MVRKRNPTKTNIIGDALRAKKELFGLSETRLGEMYGVSRGTVQQHMYGLVNISRENFIKYGLEEYINKNKILLEIIKHIKDLDLLQTLDVYNTLRNTLEK